jgi:hypothetical protein
MSSYPENEELVPTSGGYAPCPTGTFRRRAFTQKRDGKTIKVRSSCIQDRGSKGRWQTIKRALGIGELKKGDLKEVGYDHTDDAATRHAAIDKAVKKYGRLSTLRKLNAVAVYTKNTVPSRSKTYKTDVHYVQKKYY